MFEVIVDQDFFDTENKGVLRQPGEKYTVKTLQRLKTLSSQGLVEPLGVSYSGKTKRTGKDIYIFTKKLYFIGGIETSLYNLVKTFPNRKFTIIVEDSMDFGQALRLSKYCDVKKDTGEHYKCDVALLEQYDTAEPILDRIDSRKIYHQCHADWNGLRSIRGYQNMQFIVNKARVDKILAVSDTCQRGLKDVFGYDSEIVPNILAPADEKPLTFLCLSRSGAEKGWEMVANFAKACELYGNRDFVIFATSDTTELSSIPEVITVRPHISARQLLYASDYLLQLSKNESYCYSVREAAQLSVPIIGSRIPELERIIKDGVNGYLINSNVTKAEITKIFNKIPKPSPYEEKVPEIWDKVLDGEL